jgi:signal transduction histidine kinase
MTRDVDATFGVGRAGSVGGRLDSPARGVVPRVVVLACVVVLAALTSERTDWQPLSLVVALGVTMMVADVMAVAARRVRVSAGLMVQVVAMALLGPAPAAAMGIVSLVPDTLVNRVWPLGALNNMAIFGFLGLLGGLLFEVLGASVGLDPRDTAYALLVLPISVLLIALNLGLVAASHPGLEPGARRRVLRESGLPTFPYELTNALMATATVFVWAHAGIAAVAALLLVLVVTVPLLRAIGAALVKGDDLAALRRDFDQRAAEVTRLASDRERLLSEVLEAEERERARLAESLHDGPVQRLAAIRQDAAEGASAQQLASHVDAALAETRAIISAFHPVTVRELGFEAAVRAVIAPFPAARSIALTVESTVDDRFLAGTLLLPVAQELVVNAVKHASPTRIQLSAHVEDADVVLEVSDDGVGIDTSDAGRAVQAGHLGLAMVRRRVEDAGGAFEIETRPDGGTWSRVTLPHRASP